MRFHRSPKRRPGQSLPRPIASRSPSRNQQPRASTSRISHTRAAPSFDKSLPPTPNTSNNPQVPSPSAYLSVNPVIPELHGAKSFQSEATLVSPRGIDQVISAVSPTKPSSSSRYASPSGNLVYSPQPTRIPMTLKGSGSPFQDSRLDVPAMTSTPIKPSQQPLLGTAKITNDELGSELEFLSFS